MRQERNSSLTSRQPPIVSNTEDEFRKAAAILDSGECFGGALWAAQLEQAAQAKQKIAAAPDEQKHSVFQDYMHSLREAMVAPIEQWAPKYINLAAAYPQFSKCKPTEWARARMQSVISRRLRKSDRDGAIAFCLITMSGADIEKREQWRAPSYMYGPPQQWPLLRKDPTDFVIRQEHGSLVRRMDYALQQTLAMLEVDLLIHAGQSQTSSPPADGDKTSAAAKMPRFRKPLRQKIATYIVNNPEAMDREIEATVRSNWPNLVPDGWEEPTAPGKLFTKIRARLRKNGYSL
jgi:hypothetical protein